MISDNASTLEDENSRFYMSIHLLDEDGDLLSLGYMIYELLPRHPHLQN
jgi:hypothetical protein